MATFRISFTRDIVAGGPRSTDVFRVSANGSKELRTSDEWIEMVNFFARDLPISYTFIIENIAFMIGELGQGEVKSFIVPASGEWNAERIDIVNDGENHEF